MSRPLTDEERVALSDIKDTGATLIHRINKLPEGRERSLAITKVEEAVMWAVKGMTG